jgi:hypothetical protein
VIPQLRAWHEHYVRAGFTVIGVHSPEFFWEQSRDSVVTAAQKLGIRYPVVQDNDFVIWNRYAVRGWPTTILIDRQGILRYRHIGEGAYRERDGRGHSRALGRMKAREHAVPEARSSLCHGRMLVGPSGMTGAPKHGGVG